MSIVISLSVKFNKVCHESRFECQKLKILCYRRPSCWHKLYKFQPAMRYRRPTLQPFSIFFYLTLGGAFLLFFRLLLLEKSKHLEQNKFELKDFLLNSGELLII